MTIISERDERAWREYVAMVNYQHARTPEPNHRRLDSGSGLSTIGDILGMMTGRIEDDRQK